MAYQQMCLGNVDETIGRYEFFKAPFLFDADQSVVRAALEYGYCQACVDGYDEPAAYGMAIWEDDNGFVYAETFETETDYDKAVRAAEAEDVGDEGDGE
jgi:hypothetical protein